MARSRVRSVARPKNERTSKRSSLRRWIGRSFWWLFRTIRVLPATGQILIGVVFILTGWYGVNWAYQVYHKPTEVFFPLSAPLKKSPSETWEFYGPLFKKHSTTVITPEFLAALAQVEGAGNPIAQTYWRWRLTWNPLEWYQPASSAVGMYQITNPTYQEAKRYCIHDHKVVEDGPWHDINSCWFNSLYTRIFPTHAIEMTSALLDHRVAGILKRRRIAHATIKQRQNLAAIIHLCGPRTGKAYVKRGFIVSSRQRCGTHNIARYLTKVETMKKQFSRLARKKA